MADAPEKKKAALSAFFKGTKKAPKATSAGDAAAKGQAADTDVLIVKKTVVASDGWVEAEDEDQVRLNVRTLGVALHTYEGDEDEDAANASCDAETEAARKAFRDARKSAAKKAAGTTTSAAPAAVGGWKANLEARKTKAVDVNNMAMFPTLGGGMTTATASGKKSTSSNAWASRTGGADEDDEDEDSSSEEEEQSKEVVAQTSAKTDSNKTTSAPAVAPQESKTSSASAAATSAPAVDPTSPIGETEGPFDTICTSTTGKEIGTALAVKDVVSTLVGEITTGMSAEGAASRLASLKIVPSSLRRSIAERLFECALDAETPALRTTLVGVIPAALRAGAFDRSMLVAAIGKIAEAWEDLAIDLGPKAAEYAAAMFNPVKTVIVSGGVSMPADVAAKMGIASAPAASADASAAADGEDEADNMFSGLKKKKKSKA